MLLLLHTQCWQHNHARASSPAAANARAGSSTQPRARARELEPRCRGRARANPTAAGTRVGARTSRRCHGRVPGSSTPGAADAHRPARTQPPRVRAGELDPTTATTGTRQRAQTLAPQAGTGELEPGRRRRRRAQARDMTVAFDSSRFPLLPHAGELNYELHG
jgi:hypothetical protein